MHSRWNEEAASQFSGDLAQRVYTSRLLGQDSTLVLHGGGNTSVKTKVANLYGEQEEILYVKGSGWDLETIEAEGFAPCRMKDLLRLAELETLSDPQMAVSVVLTTTSFWLSSCGSGTVSTRTSCVPFQHTAFIAPLLFLDAGCPGRRVARRE